MYISDFITYDLYVLFSVSYTFSDYSLKNILSFSLLGRMLGYNRLSPAGKGEIPSFHAGAYFTSKKGGEMNGTHFCWSNHFHVNCNGFIHCGK